MSVSFAEMFEQSQVEQKCDQAPSSPEWLWISGPIS